MTIVKVVSRVMLAPEVTWCLLYNGLSGLALDRILCSPFWRLCDNFKSPKKKSISQIYNTKNFSNRFVSIFVENFAFFQSVTISNRQKKNQIAKYIIQKTFQIDLSQFSLKTLHFFKVQS